MLQFAVYPNSQPARRAHLRNPGPSTKGERFNSAEITTNSSESHHSFSAGREAPLTPLEYALTQLFILKDFISFRIRGYRKMGWASSAITTSLLPQVEVNSLPRGRDHVPNTPNGPS